MPRRNDRVKARILALHQSGLAPVEIARVVQKSRQRVHEVLKLADAHIPQEQIIELRRQRVGAMAASGLSGLQIARELGCVSQTVYNDLAALGLGRSRLKAN